MIDNEHLIIGFTSFELNALVGGKAPYLYIKKDKNSVFKEHLFTMYQSWFEHLWDIGKPQVSCHKGINNNV